MKILQHSCWQTFKEKNFYIQIGSFKNIQKQFTQLFVNMDYDQIKEKTLAFFEVSTHPNIIGRRKKLQILLIDLPEIPFQTSIKIIDGIVNGLIELMTHSFIPCQIKYDQIARCDQKWGITNAICFRSQQEDSGQYQIQVYDNVEYQDHLNAQNQLIWNIGKIWFQMLTQTQVPYIFEIEQDIIHKNIQKYVKDKQVGKILKKMLTVDCEKRLTFTQLIQSGVLFSCYDQQQAQRKSQLVTHFYPIQSNGIFKKSQQALKKQQIPGSFQEQLFYRDFGDQLQIDNFIEETKRVVKAQFSKSEFNLETSQLKQIQFILQIVDAMRLYLFEHIVNIKIEKGYEIPIKSKIDYNGSINRMLFLQGQVKKVKKIQKFKQFQSRIEYQELFSEKIKTPNPKHIIQHYKQNMNFLIKKIKQVYNEHIQDINKLEATRMIAKLMLLRLIDYVFQSSREYLFGDLFPNKKQIKSGFCVKEIVKRIDNCTDMNLLRNMQKKMRELYF